MWGMFCGTPCSIWLLPKMDSFISTRRGSMKSILAEKSKKKGFFPFLTLSNKNNKKNFWHKFYKMVLNVCNMAHWLNSQNGEQGTTVRKTIVITMWPGIIVLLPIVLYMSNVTDPISTKFHRHGPPFPVHSLWYHSVMKIWKWIPGDIIKLQT